MYWFTIFLVLFLCVLVNRWRIRKLIILGNKLKSDTLCLPVLGHSYKFIGNDEAHMKVYQHFGREAIKKGGLTSVWLLNQLFVVTSDPEISELILKTFLDKSQDVLRFVRDFTGNGSIFAPVSLWRPRRKILAPIFSPKNLNSFVKVFSKHTFTMIDQLKNKATGEPFSIWMFFTTLTMDSVCDTVLGVNVDAQHNHDQPFLNSFQQVSQCLANRSCKPWLYSDLIYHRLPEHRKFVVCKEYMQNFIDNMIKTKRKALEAKKQKENNNKADIKEDSYKTFLELLIEQSGGDQGYSDIELREETMVLLIAGTDTSAVGSSFTTVMLARHPDIQEKVYEELQEVLGKNKRKITAEDLPRLKYLEAVIRETLRLYPPVPFTIRQCHKDFTLPSGVTLVKDCHVIIHQWAIHRNPDYWGPDAERFRPERFLETPLKHPAQFISFSHGPRNCLGYQYAMMSMKTSLAALIYNYKVLPPTPHCKSDFEDKPLRLKFEIMMKDVDNYVIRLEPRVHNK